MAKGKKKKKKYSQADCDSSTAKESHGTKIYHGEAPAITECTCLTQPPRRKRFLPCLARNETPPNCPIHSSKDSTVVQKPKSKGKEKDATKQPCLVRRIGRWLMKKLTKGKNEEEIPTELLEPESATECVNIDEPPRLQILCHQALCANRPEGTAQASKTTDNSVEPESIDKTMENNVNPETDRNTVISLTELCIAVAHNTDNSDPNDLEHNIDDTKTDDTEEKDNHDTKDSELDNVSLSSECDGSVLITMIQLCTKDVNADDKAVADADSSNANDAEINNKEVNLDCDAKQLMSLKDICTAAIEAAKAKTTDIIETEYTGRKTTDINDSKHEYSDEEPQSKESKWKSIKQKNDDLKPKCYQYTMLSLKELCKAAAAYPDNSKHYTDNIKTNHIDNQDNKDTNDPELDKTNSKYDANVLMTLSQLCAKEVTNAYDKNNTSMDDKMSTNDAVLYTKDVNLECDNKKLMPLKDICIAAIQPASANTMSVIDSKNSPVNDGIPAELTESNNTRVFSLKEMCSAAIRNSHGLKSDACNKTAEQVHDKVCKSNDNKVAITENNLEYDENSTKASKDLCLMTVGNVDDMKASIYDTQNDQNCEQDLEKSNKEKDIDQYMTKESDTKKECSRELLHLATNLNKLSEATKNNIDSGGIIKSTNHNEEHTDGANRELAKQNIEIKATHKRQDKAATRVNGRGRETQQDIMMTKIDKTVDAARTVTDEAGIGYQKDNKTDKYETKMASEDGSQDVNPELVLPVENLCQLMVDTYNERRYGTKTKSRKKARLQFGIDYYIDMEGKIIGGKLPENLHTLTDNEHMLPIVNDKKNMKKGKQGKVNSHPARKAGKDRKEENGARQSSHTLPEQETEAKLKPNSRTSGDENMTLATLYCDDVVYISKTTRKATTNQTPSEVSELVEGQRGPEQMHLGVEGQARPGSGKDDEASESCATQASEAKKDQINGTETSSESSNAEQTPGGVKGLTKAFESLSESCATQISDTTAAEPESQATVTSQRWHRKKKQKRKRAKWY